MNDALLVTLVAALFVVIIMRRHNGRRDIVTRVAPRRQRVRRGLAPAAQNKSPQSEAGRPADSEGISTDKAA